MNLTIAVSTDERARGQLSPATAREAYAAFRKHGCVQLRDVFPPSAIDAMYQDYVARYGALNAREMGDRATKSPLNPFIARGEARYEIRPRMSGAFGAPVVFANGLLRRFLAPLLGDDMHLSSLTLVVSHPGASLQPIHRDHPHLFAEPGVAENLPVYAVNIVVPLIDVDIATGPTGVWPGSHQWPSSIQPQPGTVTASSIQRGDCMLVDYRTLHTGLPNRSRHVRPVVYMVYARTWFFDFINNFGAGLLDMSLEDYGRLPESTRPLLVRALSQAIRDQGHNVELVERAHAVERNPNDPSSWGKVGRNDSCPCGSTRKYKQCHGRLPDH